MRCAAGPYALLQGAAGCVRCASCVGDIWSVRTAGAPAIAHAQHERLAALIATARRESPFYREHYAHLPTGTPALAQLPVVTRAALMARFDEWVTDRAVTRAALEDFIADPARIGERFRSRYLVWKSSGTSGVPGLYVHGEDAVSTYDALMLAQLRSLPLATGFATGMWLRGGRSALIAATGEHFASICSWERQARENPWSSTLALSVLQPPAEWVETLNAYQPAFLAAYPTVLALLAAEQRAGRLDIRPSLVWSGGERLTPSVSQAIAHAFGCPVANEYGASECMSIAFGCEAGWLHVNADWVVLEPVDARMQPTPHGKRSHTVLLTNLANHVQPLIRYDLGDRIVMKAEPCECGNPLPAIRVDGRSDDVLVLRSAAGAEVPLLPLALTTVAEEAGALHRFQILQCTAECIALRVDPGDAGGRRPAAIALRAFLRRHGLGNVEVVQDAHPLVFHPRSGKFRQVVALKHRSGEA